MLIDCLDDLGQSFRFHCEGFTEYISSPLHTMEGLFGEHFECAMRNITLFSWVSFASISLCFIWNDHLHMTFRAKCSTL